MAKTLYFEIQADDLDRAINFYGKVLGWKFSEAKGLPVRYWRIMADGIQVVVFAHVTEIAVTQFDRPPQRLDGLVRPLEQRVAARQVVVRQRVVGPQLNQTLVDLQTLGVAALKRKVVALDAQDIDIGGMAVENAAEEIDFEVQLTLVG